MDFLAFLKAAWAVFLSFFMAISPAGFPRVPNEKNLELIWSDEFDGDALDLTKWEGHNTGAGATVVRRGSYWNTDFATVKDGNLHIRTEYCPEGWKGNGKPGWYTCGIDTNGLFEATYGYFECRCILPKGAGLWSAFWLMPHNMAFNNLPGEIEGGADGAEIDIFESAFYDTKYPRRISSNIHVDGYGANLRSSNVCEPYLLYNDPYESFNTYGLEWNENEYIFYVNGIETGRSDFSGVSQVPEYLILSIEVGGNDAVPGDSWAGRALTQDEEITDLIVDYVRAYQYKN